MQSTSERTNKFELQQLNRSLTQSHLCTKYKFARVEPLEYEFADW